jgi:hypothetical protein
VLAVRDRIGRGTRADVFNLEAGDLPLLKIRR